MYLMQTFVSAVAQGILFCSPLLLSSTMWFSYTSSLFSHFLFLIHDEYSPTLHCPLSLPLLTTLYQRGSREYIHASTTIIIISDCFYLSMSSLNKLFMNTDTVIIFLLAPVVICITYAMIKATVHITSQTIIRVSQVPFLERKWLELQA